MKIFKHRFPQNILKAVRKEEIPKIKAWVSEHGIDWQDRDGYTLLIHAGEKCSYSVGRWCVEQGADISIPMKQGYTVIDIVHFAGEFRMGAYTKESLAFVRYLESNQQAEQDVGGQPATPPRVRD